MKYPAALPTRTLVRLALFVCVAIIIGGCTSPPIPGPSVDELLESQPLWETLSPSAEENEGVALDVEPTTEERFDDSGTLFTCVQRPHSITKNPVDIVLANPDINLMWPGALIHGDSHLQPGALRLLAVDESRRAPITISASGGGLLGVPAGVSRRVEAPAPSSVREAINDIIVGAIESDVAVGAGRSSFMSSYSHSAEQAVLEAGFSAHYLGASAAGRLQYESSVERITYTATFVQNLFTIAVDPPEQPSKFFSDDVSADDLRALGISDDNIPLYVESVSYGRIVMFSFTSTESRSQIEAALELAYDGGFAGGGLTAGSAEAKTLSEADIRVFAIGGSNDGLVGLLRDGQLAEYFDAEFPINTVEPVSFTLKTLAGNRTATVSNTYEYNIEECLPRKAGPPILDFEPELVNHNMPIETPYDTVVADVNDDDRADLVFNHLRRDNEIMVALGNADGGFDLFDESGAPHYLATHPERVDEGWSSYELHIGDIDGDELDDLIWNYRDTVGGESFNVVYIALATTDAGGAFSGFDFVERQLHPDTVESWELYDLLIGDVTGDGSDDLVWNITAPIVDNRTYTAVAADDGIFTFSPVSVLPGPGWQTYQAALGYLDEDQRADLIWTKGASSPSYVHRSESVGDGTFTHRGAINLPTTLTSCDFLTGQVDENVTTDLVRVDLGCRTDDLMKMEVQVAFNDGGDYGLSGVVGSEDEEADWTLFTPHLADFNGDGQIDLLFDGSADGNTTIKRVYVALATDDPARPYTFSPARQDHTARPPDWTQYDTLIGDVNGDGFDDVIWVFEGPTSRIYVALAKDR